MNVSLVDQDSGETVYSSNEKTIPVADTETVNFPNVDSSENTNTYDVVITYDTGGLEGLTAEGSITGRLELNSSSSGGSVTGAFYQINSLSSNSPVDDPVNDSEQVSVSYTLENTGGSSGSQTVDLLVNGSVVNSTSVNLDAGSTESGSLGWSPSASNISFLDYNLTTDDESSNGEIGVIPSDGWEFVDVSQVNQSTVDTGSMSDFYIMKYEASRQGNATSGLSYEPVSRENHVPWVQITQNEAINKCQQAGFNLPSNRQWQAATMAEIGNSSTQPLGNTNNNEDSNGDQGIIDSTSPDWNSDGENDRTLTGSGPDSWANTIGVYDLNGNVFEWTSTVVDQSHPMHKSGSYGNVSSWNNNGYPETLGSSNSDFGGDFYWSSSDDNRAVRRGGYADNGADAGMFAMTLTYAPSDSHRAVGFRCSFS